MKQWTLVLVGLNLLVALGALLFWPPDKTNQPDGQLIEAPTPDGTADTNSLSSSATNSTE